ncbi:hypothetical protein ES705_27289 [subsurface metagenome]
MTKVLKKTYCKIKNLVMSYRLRPGLNAFCLPIQHAAKYDAKYRTKH